MKTITATADIEIEHFDNFDDALACALRDAPPGCVISVHDEACAVSRAVAEDVADETITCTCDAFEIVAGAKA